jgi:hypothetical protein
MTTCLGGKYIAAVRETHGLINYARERYKFIAAGNELLLLLDDFFCD